MAGSAAPVESKSAQFSQGEPSPGAAIQAGSH